MPRHLTVVRAVNSGPTGAELAAVEAEMPAITAEVELLDVEIALMNQPPSEVGQRRLRREHNRLLVARAEAANQARESA